MNVHHVALRTADLLALERFYVDVVGLVVMRRNEERSVWLAAGPTIVMLERREPEEEAAVIDRRSMELTCFAIDPKAHASFVERLTTAGTTIEDRTQYSIYFRDPDGRRIGVSSYPEPLD